jgi:hypothetical protein
MVHGHRREPGRGSVKVPHYPKLGLPAPNTLHAGLMVARRESELRRGRGFLLRWEPLPLFGPAIAALGYNIYSNAGSGPINYSTPVATVYGLTWTSGPLAYPDTWMFGVRAFDSGGEEQNLDAAITLILDGGGNDITNRPIAPFGLRAFATAGGGIRAEWSYNVINPTPVPTGFHVYIGTPTVSYSSPAATVSFQAAIAGTFVANIPGLTSGDVYQVGVRAYNGVAEEPNTVTVTVTADSVGPSPVISLAAIAVA